MTMGESEMAPMPMPLIPIIWSMIAGGCLAVAAVQLAAWMRTRTLAATLAFGVLALSVAIDALFELALMRADTAARMGQLQRWMHVPLFFTVLSILVFVRTYLRAGRLWLAYTICALRIAALFLDFILEPNIEFAAITGVAKIQVLGEPVSIAVGIRNPWVAVLVVSVFLLIFYVVDATVAVWRRGDARSRRSAVIIGGSLLAGLVTTVTTATLIRLGNFHLLYSYAVPFALLLVAIAMEISADISRSADLAGRLNKSESALERSRRRMEQATNAAGIGIWEWHLGRDTIWMNDSGRAFFGYARGDEITFRRFFEKVLEDDREYFLGEVMRSRGGGSFDREYRVQAAAGLRWIHTRGSVEMDAKGAAVLMRGVFFDVSARREAAERFRLVVEAAANGLVMLDTDGRVTLVNVAMQRIFGYPREELEGRSLRELLLPQRGQDAGPAGAVPIEAGWSEVGTLERTARRKDGTTIDLEIATTPIRTSNGTEALVSIVDISDRKRRDSLIRKDRAFLRQVIDIDPNLIFAKDREGRFTLANEAVAEIYGTSVEALIGRTDADFDNNASEVEAFRLADLEVMDSLRERFIAEERLTDSKGRVHFLQTVKRPIVGEDGVARQVLGVSTDITARKQAQLELDRQRNELAHLSRVTLVSELSGSIAHELNQPLAAIMSNAEAARALLRRDPPELDEVREILDDIVSDDWRAAQIISGMRSLLRKGGDAARAARHGRARAGRAAPHAQRFHQCRRPRQGPRAAGTSGYLRRCRAAAASRPEPRHEQLRCHARERPWRAADHRGGAGDEHGRRGVRVRHGAGNGARGGGARVRAFRHDEDTRARPWARDLPQHRRRPRRAASRRA